jgi:predicted DNA-binding protein YlxM (UPF0122 family)
MAKMDELYNDIYEYCEKNDCWTTYNSISGWNEVLGASYAPASFTALVNHGKLDRFKDNIYYNNKNQPYKYQLAPIGKVKEKIEKAELEDKIRRANNFIERYEEKIKFWKDSYGKQIAELESKLETKLLDLKDDYEEAKALIDME